MCATRFWWMLRALGFDGAAVLDVGFDKWLAEGRPTETGPARDYRPARFTPSPRPHGYCSRDHQGDRNDARLPHRLKLLKQVHAAQTPSPTPKKEPNHV
jgi:thiosulfate/3-mercaptopyruvate sulfurtransferase